MADILFGIVGGIIGGCVVGMIGLQAGGLISSILVAILGAVILIWITRLIKEESLTTCGAPRAARGGVEKGGVHPKSETRD